ncbi:tyrosine-type recombinase/integrase [Acidobacteria bacterium AH-259-D05]|nr:tyrosine-type recombinase/integrase [Acidobacteria bacterium AH-259-D05]
MKKEWPQEVLVEYRESAKHLFGYPDSTLQEYLRDLTRFQKWLAQRLDGNSAVSSKSTLLECNRQQVEEFIVLLSNRGLRNTTINRKIYSLNSFYLWAVHQELLDVSPLAGVRKLKTPRRIPKFLTFDDIQRLLTYTGSLRRTSTIRGKQIHAMISILYYLGLRREELVNICFEHIEKVTEMEIYLNVFGKGDKQRLIPFPEPAFRAYNNYVRFRPECSCRQVFVSLKTRQPLSKFDVNNVCVQLSKRVKLSKKLTPHLFRHTFATHLHLKGQPIEHINALLGHESLNTTKIYVHIDAGKLRASVEELCKLTTREE